jgi:hypothetical protein
MSALEGKSFDSPDEVREFKANGRIELVNLESGPVGKAIFVAKEAFNIPAGHDAWTVGDEPCVLLDFGGLEGYAQPSG